MPPNGTNGPPPFYDVGRDGSVSPLDVLLVINALNAGPLGEGEHGLENIVVVRPTRASDIARTILSANVIVFPEASAVDTPSHRNGFVDPGRLDAVDRCLVDLHWGPYETATSLLAEGIDRVRTLSDYAERDFGAAYGVLIKGLMLLARAIFVVGADGVLTHVQIVPEITDHPDYAAALAAAREAAQ